MIFEHFALNVSDPVKIAEWYVEHLGMEIVKAMDKPPFTHFIADNSGRVVMELYHNDAADIPNYRKDHHLKFHVAFAVSNAEFYKNKLIAAGAELVEELKPEEGTQLVMLKDPFGISLQICQRADAFAVHKAKLSKYLENMN